SSANRMPSTPASTRAISISPNANHSASSPSAKELSTRLLPRSPPRLTSMCLRHWQPRPFRPLEPRALYPERFLLRARRRHNPVHAQVLDDLPIVIVRARCQHSGSGDHCVTQPIARRLQRLIIPRRWIRAATAEHPPHPLALHQLLFHYLAVIADALAAHRARNPRRLVSRQLASIERNPHPLHRKQFLIRQLAIRSHLLRILFQMRKHFARPLPRAFERGNAHRTSSLGGLQPGSLIGQPAKIEKARRHLPPVTKFQRALAQAATRHHSNRIRRTAVDLDECNQPLPVGTR